MYLSKKNFEELKNIVSILDMTQEELEIRFTNFTAIDSSDWNWFLRGYIEADLKDIIDECEIGN